MIGVGTLPEGTRVTVPVVRGDGTPTGETATATVVGPLNRYSTTWTVIRPDATGSPVAVLNTSLTEITEESPNA